MSPVVSSHTLRRYGHPCANGPMTARDALKRFESVADAVMFACDCGGLPESDRYAIGIEWAELALFRSGADRLDGVRDAMVRRDVSFLQSTYDRLVRESCDMDSDLDRLVVQAEFYSVSAAVRALSSGSLADVASGCRNVARLLERYYSEPDSDAEDAAAIEAEAQLSRLLEVLP